MANPLFSLRSYGAEGQNRTVDTGIFSRIFQNFEIPVFSTKGQLRGGVDIKS